MLQHFEKLRSPLKSVQHYPSLCAQENRFLSARWQNVTAMSLWEMWSNLDFITSQERMWLNSREQFDEWEEFALFASHYFLLVASTTNETILSEGHAPVATEPSASYAVNGSDRRSAYREAKSATSSNLYRRFGAIFELDRDVFGHHGGSTGTARTSSTDCWFSNDSAQLLRSLPSNHIGPRLCHTITTLNEELDCLLIGGRRSPDRALKDCWLRRQGSWARVDDLPFTLYRHSATLVRTPSSGQGVLVFGGRSENGAATNEWLLWQDGTGWMKVKCPSFNLKPRFSAAMASCNDTAHGLLVGGITDDGTVIQEAFTWTIDLEDESPSVVLRDVSAGLRDELQDICRFGACLVDCPLGTILIGGVQARRSPLKTRNIVSIRWHTHPIQDDIQVEPLLDHLEAESMVPSLLVGHSAIWDRKGLVVVGGGATCFSFGSYNNQHVWRLRPDRTVEIGPWMHQQHDPTKKALPEAQLALGATKMDQKRTGKSIPIPKKSLESSSAFIRSVRESKPFAIECLDIGRCCEKWTMQYLKHRVGTERKVVIHRAKERAMVFHSKERNFEYVTTSFADFMDAIAADGRQYFRALASSDHKKPADFHRDFEEIAQDFTIPPELDLLKRNFHSSVLRISGPVAMWLHYDVMANVLFQIRGTKKLLLFPPKDAVALKIPPGESSSKLDLFDPATFEDGSLRDVVPNEVTLEPGEALFIPPFWPHAALPNDGMSVAVNVFFRDFDADVYAKARDTYGNRDLQAYEDGRRGIAKILKRFEDLPEEVSKFYLRRLGHEILERTG